MAKFSKINQPVKCRNCGETTQSSHDSVGIDLCTKCYELAGWENEHSDRNHKEKPNADCPICAKTICAVCDDAPPSTDGKGLMGNGLVHA